MTTSLLYFEQAATGGLTWRAITAGDEDIPEVCWTRLFTGDYPDDEALNPLFRFSVNDADGEFLAVWRALAWAITRAPALARALRLGGAGRRNSGHAQPNRVTAVRAATYALADHLRLEEADQAEPPAVEHPPALVAGPRLAPSR